MSAYTVAVLADSPQVYYRLDEVSGSVANDSSGNGHNATIAGASYGQAGALPSDSDTSMTFTASGGITFPNSVNVTTFGAATLEYWAKNGGGWHHIVIAVDATGTTYYLDGALTTPTGPVTAANTFNDILLDQVGSFMSADGLDEIALYNTKLSASRVLAHYTASGATPSSSPSSQGTGTNKYQLVKIYDPSGNFLDIIHDAPFIQGYKDNISAASDNLKIVLPRLIDAYDGLYQPGTRSTIVLGNNIQFWMYGLGLPANGLLRYNGIIDTITPKIDEGGKETVEILITPYSQLAIGDHSVTSTITFGTAGSAGTYIDTGVIFSSFFTGSYQDSTGTTQSTIDSITSEPYGDPYAMASMSANATGVKTQFAFQNQTILSALTSVLALGPPNYFFRMNHDKTVFFQAVSTSPTYTLLLGAHITSIEYSIDNVPRYNVVVVQGKGVQGKYVGSSVSTIGQRVYFKSDNRITDTNTAQDLANGLGAIYDRQFVRAKIKIPDYRGDSYPGLGFDIEKFQVGETVKIVDTRAPSVSTVGIGMAWGSGVWGSSKWGSDASSGAPGTGTIWGSFNWGGAAWGLTTGTIFATVVPIMSVQYDYWSVTLELGWRQPTLNRKLYALEAAFADATLVT